MTKRLLKLPNGKKNYNPVYTITKENGTEVLYYLQTAIMQKTAKGQLERITNGWNENIQTAIETFCGLEKKEFLKLKKPEVI